MFKALVLFLSACVHGGGLSEAPADGEVLRALPQPAQGIPFVYEEFRDDIIIVKNRLDSQGLVLPLPAGTWLPVEFGHWECVVHYTETVEASFPFPLSQDSPITRSRRSIPISMGMDGRPAS